MQVADILHNGKFYAVTCAFLWAVAVVLFRRAGEDVAPLALNLFKNVLGLGLLLLTLAFAGLSLVPEDRTPGDWALLMLSGVIGIAVADTLFFASLNLLGAGRSAIVDCLYSPLVIVFAFGLLDEPVGPMLLVAAALVGAGILVGTWDPDVRDGGERPGDLLRGVLLGAVSMALMAFGIVIAKPVLEVAEPFWATAVRLAGALPLLLVLGLHRRHRASIVACFRPGPHHRFVLPSSFIGAYLAMVLWILGFKYAEAGTAGVLNQTSNLFVLLLAWLFLREPLTWRRLVAIGLGFSGAVAVAL